MVLGLSEVQYNSGSNRACNFKSAEHVHIFIGSLTVRFDLSDYKFLVIGQIKQDSFGVTITNGISHGVSFSIELFEWGILGTSGCSRMWRAFPVLARADTSSALSHPGHE